MNPRTKDRDMRGRESERRGEFILYGTIASRSPNTAPTAGRQRLGAALWPKQP